MPAGVINITGVASDDTVAFFRKYSREKHLMQLIDDFMPTFYTIGDDDSGYEEVNVDGRSYKNINDEKYSFDEEAEEEFPPWSEEPEKYYTVTHHFSFSPFFENAVLKQKNVALGKIISTIYKSPGGTISLFEAIFQDCNSFLENVLMSSLHKKFPYFSEAILGLIDFLESRYKLFCPLRNRFSNLVVKPVLKEELTIKTSDFEELETQIAAYYSRNEKKYFVIEGTLPDFLYKLSTQTLNKYKFKISIKPYKNFFYLLSVLKKAASINLDLLNDNECIIISDKKFLTKYMDDYPSAAERLFRQLIDDWVLTLKK